ncbi:MAG: hypothetical protein KC478_08970, partial [Bacteriovoracaceae bacterium]|nr:hypothetical protein [Bacteriovoracaceae bacterium]
MVPFRVFTFVLGLSVLLSSAQASDCPEGQYYHSSLQRCLLNKKTVSTKTNANRCEGKSGDEYAKCFKDNIEDEIKDLEKAESISQGNWHKATVPLTVGLLAGYYLVTNKDTFSQCKATSIWLMLGGAAAGAVTEISAQLTYSKKIKSVHEKYNKQISETRASDDEETQKSTEAQTLALEAMKEQEGARLKA